MTMIVIVSVRRRQFVKTYEIFKRFLINKHKNTGE